MATWIDEWRDSQHGLKSDSFVLICPIASGNWGSTSCYENQARLQQTGDRDGTVEATAPGYRLPADAAEPAGV